MTNRVLTLLACTFAAMLSTAPLIASSEDDYLRVVEEPGERLSLEVAARRFTHPEGEGPEVALISVAHIADAELYRTIDDYLAGFDVVLFESVGPPGAGRPHGETDDARAVATVESLEFLGSLVEAHRASRATYPTTMKDLAETLPAIDPRLVSWLALASVDAWGTAVRYETDDAGTWYRFTSFGADGQPGGDHADADLTVTSTDGPTALDISGDEGLQARLAELLGMSFQLDEIDYARPNFVASDMTMTQLELAFAERGLEFSQLGSTLAGSAFPPVVVDALVRMVRMLDVVLDGMVSDMTKVIMIEMLGDESLIEGLLDDQFGGGFVDVIIRDRNQVVMDQFGALRDADPSVESVAIFYGAAHMQDFEERLADQYGYQRSSVDWMPAMSIDLRKTSLSAREIGQIRGMLRSTLRRMAR